MDEHEFGAALRKAAITAAEDAARAEVGRLDVAKVAREAAEAATAASAAGWQATLAEGIARAAEGVAAVSAASEALSKRVEAFDLDKISLAYAEARAADRRASAERAEIFAKVDAATRQLALAEIMAERLLKAAEQVEELGAALELRLMEIAEDVVVAKVDALRGEWTGVIRESAPEQALGFRRFLGPWAEGVKAERGDVLVHKGSAWIAERETDERPVAKAGGPFLLLAGAIAK